MLEKVCQKRNGASKGIPLPQPTHARAQRERERAPFNFTYIPSTLYPKLVKSISFPYLSPTSAVWLLAKVPKLVVIVTTFVTSNAFRYLVPIVVVKICNCNYNNLCICSNCSYGKTFVTTFMATALLQ